jgi:hypothetical protein
VRYAGNEVIKPTLPIPKLEAGQPGELSCKADGVLFTDGQGHQGRQAGKLC